MKILLYGINYAPEITGIGKYSGEMAEWFAQQGHEVRVITAPPYYPEWSIGSDYKPWTYLKETINAVCVFRCPLYIPAQPKTLSRLVHLCSFALSSFPVVLSQLFWRPAVVITVEPTFFCTPAALLLAKLSGAKSVLHIQDYELDAMLGLGMGSHGALSSFAHTVESWVMRGFDRLSSISFSMLNKANFKTHYQVPTLLFPNWVDIDFVNPDANAIIFRKKWRIPESTKVVLYSGNMGKKQGLEIVIEAARHFSNQSDVLFIMVGTGAAFKGLKKLAKKLHLSNIQFYPLQPYKNLPCLMALADVHLVVQKKGVADAVLPSKLTTILSVGGTALITAEDNTELGLLCANYPGIACCIDPEDLVLFCDSLQLLLDKIDANHRAINSIARGYAVHHLAKDAVLEEFEAELIKLKDSG